MRFRGTDPDILIAITAGGGVCVPRRSEKSSHRFIVFVGKYKKQIREEEEPVRRVVILMAGALAVMATGLQPASAEDTTVTFTVTAGPLTIAVPTAVDLGSGDPSTTIADSLGTVTVTDARGANPSAWTATVSSTDFTASGVPAIPASAVTYTPGAATATSGDGNFTPGTPAALSSTPITAFTHSAGTGSNTCSWNPTLSVAVPNTATAVTYTGTVTHLVA
ncbi:hypothetical protein GCM10010517_69790 [Streptosporangium fragile]|uniref:WxL domain-containing protein n=1 Tax=Streptosporangium fragile TaxID=46186 RepID=A0ABN3W8M4_9ACTN